MSDMILSSQTTISPDHLPILPETHSVEPIVQCGVLYLGTAPMRPGVRGLDSIQEPFSHRYPVDGTSTVRGIDAVLSVYDNGIQLTFTRYPHTIVFFPINSLIYCASLRFSIIENDHTKRPPNVHWRFMPLDTCISDENKHPPLFSIVVKRTHILPGDECHCFITKNTDAAFALVRTLSQVYANLKSKTQCLRSPIFYQLDHFGRKLSEISGTIYLSPANDDDSQLNRTNPIQLKDASSARKYLFDPSLDGYYYRTDASLVEQWHLWDDDNLTGSRPHPPDSPFGLHEGLYHDDTTQEIQRYLRHMDDEDQSCSCSYPSKSSSSGSSISTDYSRRHTRHRRRSNNEKSIDNTDEFNESFSQLQTSSFEPLSTPDNLDIKETRHKPIIIEKVIPKQVLPKPILTPKLPQQPLDLSKSIQEEEEEDIDYIASTNVPSFSYHINKRGEKITKEGNRIVFMDTVRPNTSKKPTEPPLYTPVKPRSRSHRRRLSRRIPVIDIQTIERLSNENRSKSQRRASISVDNNINDHLTHTNHVVTSDMLELLGGYFEDPHGHKIKLKNHEIQSLLSQFEVTENKQEERRKNSVVSSTDSSKSETRHRRSRSIAIVDPSVNHQERPLLSPKPQSQLPSIVKQKPLTLPVVTDETLKEYVTNIYGTARSVKSTTSSNNQQETKALDQNVVINAGYLSAFRYMHSSFNPNYLHQFHDAY